MTAKKNLGPAIVERLEKAFDSHGNTALGNAIGKSDKVVWSWKSGNALPKLDELLAIADLKGLSIHWLLTGDGAMMHGDIDESEERRLTERIGGMMLEMMRDIVPYLLKTGTLSGSSASSDQTDDRPFVIPTPPARQQAGPPPSPEAFESRKIDQEGIRSPVRRS